MPQNPRPFRGATLISIALRGAQRGSGTRRALVSTMKLRSAPGHSICAWSHTLPAILALSLSVACGSSQADPLSAGGGAAGAAGAAGNVSSGGSGAHGGMADQGGGSGGANAGSGGHPSGGTGGSAVVGAGGAMGGAGATGGTGGGAQTPSCPATRPVAASSCAANGQACRYEDCAGVGRTAAACDSGAWVVQSAACAAVQCIGLPSPMS